MKGLSPLWIIVWLLSPFLEEKVLGHESHLNFFSIELSTELLHLLAGVFASLAYFGLLTWTGGLKVCLSSLVTSVRLAIPSSRVILAEISSSFEASLSEDNSLAGIYSDK